jgi:hypothetical protein
MAIAWHRYPLWSVTSYGHRSHVEFQTNMFHGVTRLRLPPSPPTNTMYTPPLPMVRGFGQLAYSIAIAARGRASSSATTTTIITVKNCHLASIHYDGPVADLPLLLAGPSNNVHHLSGSHLFGPRSSPVSCRRGI